MKNRIVQKMKIALAVIVTFAGLMFVTGCNPEKVGGGGLLQSYSRATGQYN